MSLEQLPRCMMYRRAQNFALLNIDFRDKYIRQENVVERVTLGDKVAGYGGVIGNIVFSTFGPRVNLQ